MGLKIEDATISVSKETSKYPVISVLKFVVANTSFIPAYYTYTVVVQFRDGSQEQKQSEPRILFGKATENITLDFDGLLTSARIHVERVLMKWDHDDRTVYY